VATCDRDLKRRIRKVGPFAFAVENCFSDITCNLLLNCLGRILGDSYFIIGLFLLPVMPGIGLFNVHLVLISWLPCLQIPGVPIMYIQQHQYSIER